MFIWLMLLHSMLQSIPEGVVTFPNVLFWANVSGTKEMTARAMIEAKKKFSFFNYRLYSFACTDIYVYDGFNIPAAMCNRHKFFPERRLADWFKLFPTRTLKSSLRPEKISKCCFSYRMSCLISDALLLLSFNIIIAVIMMKAISNSSVTILREFIGNALPFVIGFGTLVITQMMINTIVPPRPK